MQFLGGPRGCYSRFLKLSYEFGGVWKTSISLLFLNMLCKVGKSEIVSTTNIEYKCPYLDLSTPTVPDLLSLEVSNNKTNLNVQTVLHVYSSLERGWG